MYYKLIRQPAQGKAVKGTLYSVEHRYFGLSSITRTSPLSQKEINNRQKFKTVRLAAQERSLSLSSLSGDQAKFDNEKKQTGFKYTTFLGWLFSKAWRYYDRDTNTVTWPQNL